MPESYVSLCCHRLGHMPSATEKDIGVSRAMPWQAFEAEPFRARDFPTQRVDGKPRETALDNGKITPLSRFLRAMLLVPTVLMTAMGGVALTFQPKVSRC